MTYRMREPRFEFTPLNRLPHPDLTRPPTSPLDVAIRDLDAYADRLRRDELDRDLSALERAAERFAAMERQWFEATMKQVDEYAHRNLTIADWQEVNRREP